MENKLTFANWFAYSQLGFLTMFSVQFELFVSVHCSAPLAFVLSINTAARVNKGIYMYIYVFILLE